MKANFPHLNPLPQGERGLLEKLRTEQGDRSVYDAVSQCSRCGYCEQACPTYVVTGKEHFSGRGRNQMVRMLLEKKFENPQAADEALSTCLLCGACTSACYAHVPTADLVLEGRRMLRGDKTPWLIRLLRWFMEDHPVLFICALKIAYAFKRLGLARLFAYTRVFKLLGLGGLEIAALQVDEAPARFLSERLRKDDDLTDFRSARWFYFAPCGPNFLLPRVGEATIRFLKQRMGPGAFLDNPCCGLLFYNYGDLEAAKRLARRNIENYENKAGKREGREDTEKLGSDTGPPPLIGDCSSCVAHLKSYPQLFLEDPQWRSRAERFTERVKDIIEIPLESRASTSYPSVVTFHDSCRARHGEGLVEGPRRAMRQAFDGAYVELPEAGWCCGGAGAFAFAHPDLSDEVLKRKVSHIASIQARQVATSSTSCLLQLAQGLRKYYPGCRVAHVSELWTEAQKINAES